MKDINATVIVNITPPEDEILKNLDKDARWGINRAKKDNLIVEETNKKEDWNEFYNIYKQTIFEGGADIESIEELKKKIIVFFVCKKERKIIAGAALEMKKEKPTLYINASLKEFKNSQPNNLLYWECIIWSKKHGFKELDLGGWQINASEHLWGINKFKERWGKVYYYYEDYSFPKAIGRKLIRNFRFFWWLNKKLKGRK